MDHRMRFWSSAKLRSCSRSEGRDEPYTTDLGTGYAVTTGNVLGAITVTGDGWNATITNTNLASPLHTCAIYIGSTSTAPATKEGEPKCD